MKYKMDKQVKLKHYAITQIFLLVLSLFAISFIIGEADRVSAFTTEGVPCYTIDGCPNGLVCDLSKHQCVVASTATEEVNPPFGTLGSPCRGIGECQSELGLICDTIKHQCVYLSTNNQNQQVIPPATTGGSNVPREKTDEEKLQDALEVAGIPSAVVGTVKSTSDLINLVKGGSITEKQIVKVAESLMKGGHYNEANAIIKASNEMAELSNPSWLSKVWSGSSSFGAVGQIIAYAGVAAAAGIAARYIAEWAGASVDQAQTLGWAVGTGVFAGLVVGNGIGGTGFLAFTGLGPAGWAVGAAVILVGIAGFYKKEPHEIVQFQCLPYSPPAGGEKCELCNNQEIPCSEYQCRSLGRGCKLINPGTSEELCVYTSRGDIVPPEIQPWEEVLTEGFKYNPIEVSPEERGVKVTKVEGGDIPPFTKITFGITLNEPAKCKISFDRADSYEEMDNLFMDGYGYSTYNHSFTVSYPDRSAVEAEGYTYEEGYNEWYVRCEDDAGNTNEKNFVFKFSVDEAPDFAPPTILGSSVPNDSPIGYNITTVNSTFYLNKPSTCKWDYLDKTYEDMANAMDCVESMESTTEFNYQMAYTCDTTFSGLVNYQENKFYIRCKSYPMKTNPVEQVVMEKSYEYTLHGTRQLEITEITPNETVSSSSNVISVPLEVRTIGGLNEGESVCFYSLESSNPRWIMFYETGSYKHRQDLWFDPGTHSIFVKCIDDAGNADTGNVTLNIEADTNAPLIARAYYEDGYLKLVTNEGAECVYSLFDCEYAFEDGVVLSTDDNLNHFTPWDTTLDLYVKCQDIYLNRPIGAAECSIVVRAEDFVSPKQEAVN